MEYLAEQNIHLEVCPTCNIQTDIYNTYRDHPIDDLYENGIEFLQISDLDKDKINTYIDLSIRE